MPSTAHRGLHYPDPTDVPDITSDLHVLAAALDFDLFVITTMPRPAAGTLGRAHWDGSAWSFDNGTTWTSFLTAVPGGTYLLLAGGTMAGALDMGNQELRNLTALNVKAKRYTANISGTPTIDAANGPDQTLTLTGNVTAITLSNLDDGESLKLTLVQDATGSRTCTFPNTWIWPGGAAAATAGFKTTANAVNVVYLEKAGSSIHAFLASDLKT